MIHIIQINLLLPPSTGLPLLRRRLLRLWIIRNLLLLLLDFGRLLVIRKPHSNILRPVLPAARVEVHARTAATANDNALHFFLLQSALADALFDGAACDHAVDGDLLGLAQTMGSVHGLRVDGRIPVGVVKDDCVCGGQVDTQTTSASG